MSEIESDIWFEYSKKKKDPKREEERQKGLAILFIYENPTPIFTLQHSAEKQAVMELMFSDELVENPEVKKEKLKGYVS